MALTRAVRQREVKPVLLAEAFVRLPLIHQLEARDPRLKRAEEVLVISARRVLAAEREAERRELVDGRVLERRERGREVAVRFGLRVPLRNRNQRLSIRAHLVAPRALRAS